MTPRTARNGKNSSTTAPVPGRLTPATLAGPPPLPTVSVGGADPARESGDALVLATASTDDGPALRAPGLPRAVAGRLGELLAPLGVTGATDQVVRIPAPRGVSATTVVLVGTGPAEAHATGDEPATAPDAAETLRRAAGAAARSLGGVGTAVFALPATDAAQVGAVVEGALEGAYSFDRYRTPAKAPLGAVVVAGPAAGKDKDAAAAVERGRVVALAVCGARDLVNTAPRDLNPVTFADLATTLGTAAGLDVEVLDEVALVAGGYGGIVGVGQGSGTPPRLVRLSWEPKRRGARRAAAHAGQIALVGKGITFDSGGLSLKPPPSMEEMKSDMAGAAAVLHTLLAVAALDLPVRVTGWLALAENMPDAAAQRPSDVLTMLDGSTVEVLNTDAEGRLVLADAMVAARRHAGDDLDLLVDVATLTGAQLIALGPRTAGVMGSPAARDRVLAAAGRAGESMWPAPLPEYLRRSLDSQVADIANKGDRQGGMLVAGIFLKKFAGDSSWAHVDVAGPAFNGKTPWGATPKGGTGVPVATLVALVEDSAAR